MAGFADQFEAMKSANQKNALDLVMGTLPTKISELTALHQVNIRMKFKLLKFYGSR